MTNVYKLFICEPRAAQKVKKIMFKTLKKMNYFFVVYWIRLARIYNITLAAGRVIKNTTDAADGAGEAK